MNHINLLLVFCQSKGDNSVCIRLHTAPGQGAPSTFLANVVVPGSAEGKSKTPSSFRQGKSVSCLGCAEVLSLVWLSYYVEDVFEKSLNSPETCRRQNRAAVGSD